MRKYHNMYISWTLNCYLLLFNLSSTHYYDVDMICIALLSCSVLFAWSQKFFFKVTIYLNFVATLFIFHCSYVHFVILFYFVSSLCFFFLCAS